MTDRDALLRAVIENPEDDTPRLVFADWLDEHGEPERAELIRVQCELARWIREGKSPPDHLLTREWVLRDWHVRKVYPRDKHIIGQFWQRGFVDEVLVSDRNRDVVARMFTEHPVTAIRYWQPRSITHVTGFEPVRCVRRLVLKLDWLRIGDAEHLAESPALAGLESLTIRMLREVGHRARDRLTGAFGDRVRFARP